MKRGKKYIEAAKLIEKGNLYEKADAVALVKKAALAKFDETNEAHIRTGCDGRHADQQIRGAVVDVYKRQIRSSLFRIPAGEPRDF